jgi:hypothetical protein
MKKGDIKREIVGILLKEKFAHLEDIASHFDKEDCKDVIVVLMEDLKDVVVFDPVKGYRIKHRFGPKPLPVRPDKMKFSQIPSVTLFPKVESFPDEYLTPEVASLAHLDQAEEGDCVGCSGASLSKLLMLRVLKSSTSPEQLAAIKRDVCLPDGVVIDSLPDDTVSASAIYYMARAMMTIKPREDEDGAYVTDAAEVVTHKGIVPEWMWPTGKTQSGQYYKPPEKYAQLVKDTLPHYKFDRVGVDWTVLDGESGDPTAQIMETVTTFGGCWMVMPVFDNYGQATPNGVFPVPIAGVNRVIGYHAVVLVGWARSEGKRVWRFVNSWEGTTPLVNTIPDEGYMQVYFKTGQIQLVAVMPGAVSPFPPRQDPSPLPEPTPEPVPIPKPVPVGNFLSDLIEALISFFRSMLGKKNL